MDVTLSCECGATMQVVARDGVLAEVPSCRMCGKPLDMPEGRSAERLGESSGFALMKEPPRARIDREPEGRRLETLLRELDGLLTNIPRSAQGLEHKLTPDERTQVLATLHEAKEVRKKALDAADASLRPVVKKLEDVAGLIGRVMLRP